jgi:hypothetical protein
VVSRYVGISELAKTFARFEAEGGSTAAKSNAGWGKACAVKNPGPLGSGTVYTASSEDAP